MTVNDNMGTQVSKSLPKSPERDNKVIGTHVPKIVTAVM